MDTQPKSLIAKCRLLHSLPKRLKLGPQDKMYSFKAIADLNNLALQKYRATK